MARYEVFVPAAPPKLPVDLTLRLEADHWLGALKTGLGRLGEAQASNNVLCDIQADGSIHVTDPDTGRVFRILELPALTPVAAPPVAAPPAEPKAPVPVPPRPIGRLVATTRAEDVLAELFLEVSDLGQMQDRKLGLEFVLDNALRIIGCEAGSVFTADLGRRDLSFEVVRGPTADKLMSLGLKVPIGVGVVGFCAQENVCVAVSDVEKDPRFYRAVSEATGYQTRSLLCAPMARQGRVVGCLEVLNKKGGKPYDQKDMAVLSYLAAQAAAFLARIDG